MKVPSCSVCQNRYNDEDRVPLLLHCGHGFCADCMSHMFLASSDSRLSCPRCRYVSVVGNSIQALRKNFAVLALIHSSLKTAAVGNSIQALRKNFAALALIDSRLKTAVAASEFDCDFTDDEEDDENGDGEVNVDEESLSHRRWSGGSCTSTSGGCGPVIDLGVHKDLKLLRRIREGSRDGVEIWTAVLGGGGNGSTKCRHQVAVKKVAVGEDMDLGWVLEQLESLRRASMWCRNVCIFHGAMEMDGSLYLVMDRCYGSVQSKMQENEGRLTLEQILRYGADVARGVAELHAAGVVCMNIKPSNLLLDATGHAVVSDYGLAAILKKPMCSKARSDCDSSKMHLCMECAMLSPHYAAPEAWEPVKKSLNLFWDDGLGMSVESDAWSFACTLVEMCTGSIPWSGLCTEEIYRAVVKAKKLPPQYASIVGVGIPRELWKMIGDCLQFKSLKRPTFNKMLTTFLRYLQEIPRSPSASPDNDLAKCSGSYIMETETSLMSDSEVFRYNLGHLHRLVFDGDFSGVRDLLIKAASGSCSNLISKLLEAQNDDGQTALHLACRRGFAEIVEAILEFREAKVDILDKDGDPPLVFALAAGSPECVHILIERGANVCSRLREGFGPSVAHVCAYHGQPDCMRELLLGGADPNVVDEEGESVLHRAVTKKYSDCALVILENGGCRSMAILNSKNLTPLHMCVSTYNVAVVKKWTEVATAEEIAEAIDIPSPAGTALCMAAALKKDHESEGRNLVKLLLHAGADPAAQDAQHGRTALHTAAMANDVELVKIILNAGVDVNICNVHNTIPLHVALARGANSCTGLLLSSGANYNMQDDEGDNAFHIAADAAKMIRENLQWLIVMLRNADAAVEVRNHSGKTLHDFLEALPREWISEELLEALVHKGIHLLPTIFEVGDWVKFNRTIATPTHGWQGANHKSVGFVQSILDKGNLVVSFCSGEAHVLANEVIKVIPLDRGQHVQLKYDVKEPRFGWRGQSRDSIGTVLCVDDDGILRVGFPGASRGWKADPAEMERVEEFKVGDWVRIRPTLTTAKHGFGSVTPGSIGIVYCNRPDGSLLLELSYLPSPWHCEPEEVEPVIPFRIGDQVCVKRSVAEPRYAWGGETHHSVGRISEIESDGLLIIDIPNRPTPWQADPSDMEKVDDFKVGDWVRVKASVSSPKYGWEDISRNSIGVIHILEEDVEMGIAFCFRSKLFICSVTDVERVAPFEIGQEIHILPSITQPRLGWSNESPATVGKIARVDMDGALNVKVAGRKSLWKVCPGDAEQLSGFEVGDWVRSKSNTGNRPTYDWNIAGRDSFAVVHSVQDCLFLELACCTRRSRWLAHASDVKKVPCYKVGQYVRFRPGLSEPMWGWRGAHCDSRGTITSVHSDGEVRVAFFGVPGLWRGDPADLEIEEMFEAGEWVRLRENIDKWKSIGPGSIGVVQGLRFEGDEWNGRISVLFCGEQESWVGSITHLERVDQLVVGQKVRVKLSINQPRFGWSVHNRASVGMISAIDADGKLKIYTAAGSKPWMLDPAEVELVQDEEFHVRDWVRVKASVSTPTYQWGEVNHSSIGVVHRKENGELFVSFCFMEKKLWICKAWEMERVRPFKIGDKVRIREGLVAPRWGWGMETHASKGHVVGVDANGKLRIKFRWREGKPWIGDPADIVLDEN